MFEKEFRDRVHLCQQFDLKGRDFSFHYQAEINYFLNLWNLISDCNKSFILRCHNIQFEVLISPQISCFFYPDYHALPRLNNIGKCLVFSAFSRSSFVRLSAQNGFPCPPQRFACDDFAQSKFYPEFGLEKQSTFDFPRNLHIFDSY